MASYTSSLELPFPAADVFAWLERPGALARLTPPWERVTVLEQHGTVHDGDRVVMQLHRPPVKLEVVHEGYEAGHRFVDRQVRGPFRAWRHQHEVAAVDRVRCELRDQIEYELPLAAVSRPLMTASVERRLAQMFAFRGVVLAGDLARHARVAARGRIRVAVTGASGTIGRALCALLTTGGHEVVRLVRRAANDASEIAWDPDAGTIDGAALEGIDAMIHLAGENPGAGRWNEARKRKILDSRVRGTELVAHAIAGLRRKPEVLVSASAIGFYGADAAGACDETAQPGTDFLAEVAVAWEAAARPAAEAGVRVVHPRIGVALTPEGGALEKMLGPFSLGLGGPIGAGTQPFGWVGLDDVIYAIHWMVFERALVGPVNVVGPEPADNATFARTLAHVLGRPSVLRLPAFAIELMFGELGKVVLLGGQQAVPTRLAASGFQFAQPTLEGLLRHVLGRAT